MRNTLAAMTAAFALALATTGCTQGNAKTAAAARPANVVTITTADFSFQSPSSIPAGLTTLRLVNGGAEMHHVQLVRLDDGHTLQDLMSAMANHGPTPAWARFVGGPNTPGPGGQSETSLVLEPGNYALLCVIPSPDGTPHTMKGMVKPLTVTPIEGAVTAPEADVRMVLNDYSFDIAGELKAGRRTIQVENAASQAHEVLIAQLAPGKTPHDLLAWIEKPQGPPPGRPVGGTTGFDLGEVNFVTADFPAGEYALLCFFPDKGDGKPHVAHGMVRQITVR